ncbi:MAG: hypothetical protein ACXAD7_04490 [Candidatus Kariarchaeaceae archaeon]|jgi:ABC-type transport system involved in multi-copper enzyme maturation permease subunit
MAYVSVNRIKYHTLRFKSEFIYAAIILSAMVLLLGVMYPGEEELTKYFDLISESGMQGLLGVIGGNAPGWTLWVAMQLGPYLYFLMVIVGIKIGSRVTPTTDRDGMELLLSSTPKSSRNYFLENYFSGIFILMMIMLPAYLIMIGLSIGQDATDLIGRITVVFLFELIIALVYFTIASLFSVLYFSKSAGLKAGYGYFIFSVLMEMSAPSLDAEQQKSVNMSFNYYLHPSSGLLDGEFNWEGLGVILLIIASLVIISYWKVIKPDYTEVPSKKVIKSRLSFLPKFSPESKLAQRFPLVFDQFRKDRGFVFIWTITVTSMLVYIVASFLQLDETQLVELYATFDSNPSFIALMQNHDLPANFTGFFAYQVLTMTWLWFGIFVVIIAVNISNRDVSDETQDIIWANNITQDRVIISRTIAMLIEFSFMYWIVAGSILGTVVGIGVDANIGTIFGVFMVGWLHYMAMGIFMVAVTLIPKLKNARKYGYWLFIVIVIIFISAFSSPETEFIKYLSILAYYDPIGILLEVNKFGVALITTLGVLIASTLSYVGLLKYRFKNQDLL